MSCRRMRSTCSHKHPAKVSTPVVTYRTTGNRETLSTPSCPAAQFTLLWTECRSQTSDTFHHDHIYLPASYNPHNAQLPTKQFRLRHVEDIPRVERPSIAQLACKHLLVVFSILGLTARSGFLAQQKTARSHTPQAIDNSPCISG